MTFPGGHPHCWVSSHNEVTLVVLSDMIYKKKKKQFPIFCWENFFYLFPLGDSNISVPASLSLWSLFLCQGFLASTPPKNLSSLWVKPILLWAICPVSRAWPATNYSVFLEPLCEWIIVNEWNNISLSKREVKTVIWKASPTGFSRLILGTSSCESSF